MFGAQKPASGGLFGTSQTQSSSPFGAKAPNTTATGGLFGSAINNNNNSTQGSQFGQSNQLGQTTSLFGQTQQAQTQPAGQAQNSSGSTFGSGFGNNSETWGLLNNKPASGPLNNAFSSFSRATTNPAGTLQPQAPLSQASTEHMPVITPFTRPSDLSDAFQKDLENMNSYIRQQTQLSEDLEHAIVDHRSLVTSIPRDVQLLRFKLTSAKETLKFDDCQLAKLKQHLDADSRDTELLTDVTNQPRKYDRLLPYFGRMASCEARLDQLTAAMRDVQQAVTAEEFGNRITYDEHGLRALPRAMREEYMYFMSLSDKVAELHRHIKDEGEGEALEEMQI